MPTISVIVPVFNVEKYLCCCVDSILAQTFTDIEVLLVDDGSTDASGTICDAYAQQDSRVRVFHKENGGASSARNLGLDEATGKWVLFVDSDDMVAPQICERLLAHAAEGCQPLSMWYTWKNDEKRISSLGVEKGCHPIDRCLEIRAYGPWARLYERRLVESAGLRFIEGFPFAEDTIFNYEYYLLIKSFAVLDEPLYYYRILPNSLSHGRYIPDCEGIIKMRHHKRLRLAESLGRNDEKFYKGEYGDCFYFMCVLLANNMHKDAPGTWFEKVRRNSAVLRSEEFRKVYPYRHERPKDFTKRYMRALELAYNTGSYFWLWLVGVPGKIKRYITGKR